MMENCKNRLSFSVCFVLVSFSTLLCSFLCVIIFAIDAIGNNVKMNRILISNMNNVYTCVRRG